jgi:hypothetical protein
MSTPTCRVARGDIALTACPLALRDVFVHGRHAGEPLWGPNVVKFVKLQLFAWF